MNRYNLAIVALVAVAGSAAADEKVKTEPSAVIRKLQGGLLNHTLDPQQAREFGDAITDASRDVSNLVGLLKLHGLRDPNDYVRVHSAMALGQIGASASDAVPELAAALKDPLAEMRAKSADALTSIFQYARFRPGAHDEVVPALIRALRDDKELYVRERACVTLGMIGPDAKAAVPLLSQLLRDQKQGPLRPWVARTLGLIGPSAGDAIPAILEVINRKQEDIATQASALSIVAQVKFDEKAAMTLLIAALEDPDRRHLRQAAAGVLATYGPKAQSAVLPLAAALDAHDVDNAETAFLIKNNVVRALAAIGPDAARAIPNLQKLANDPRENASLRRRAVLAIEHIRSRKDNAAVPYLPTRP